MKYLVNYKVSKKVNSVVFKTCFVCLYQSIAKYLSTPILSGMISKFA